MSLLFMSTALLPVKFITCEQRPSQRLDKAKQKTLRLAETSRLSDFYLFCTIESHERNSSVSCRHFKPNISVPTNDYL